MAIHKKANNSFVKMPVEVLNRPENWDILKLPNKIKTASVVKNNVDFHGFDLEAEVKNHPEHLFLKIFAIKKDEINDNGDAFSEEELKKAAHTFVGVPLFTNHQNDDIEKAKGDCVHSWYDEDAGGIFIIGRVDKVAYPQLARGIEQGIITGTSMGTTVESSVCSVCHNQANVATDYCTHVANRKNRKFSGEIKCQYHNSPTDIEDKCPICGSTKDDIKTINHNKTQIYEHNFGLKFIENSFVVNPACYDCGVSEILHIPNVTRKIAEIKENVIKISKNIENDINNKNNKLKKVAGQQEINMLKESMENVENVVKSMLQQKEQISMEYVSDLVKAMSDIQEVMDELVEMGYTKLASPSNVSSDVFITPQPSSVVPPQPSAPKPISEPPVNPEVASEDLSGLGSVTKPKFSEKNINKKEDFIKVSSNLIDSIKELESLINKIKIQDNDKELNNKMATNKKDTKTAASEENQSIITEKQLEKTILIIEKITNTEPEKFGSDVLKDITFVELLIIISNFFNNNTNKNSTSNFKFNKVYPIIKYIERNIEGDLSLDSISDNFYISKYHLCRIFKESTGFTLREYIINTRILKSCTFLRKGCNVQTAGELAGFNNNSHFIRTFSKLKGISPGQYMKKYK